MLQTFFLNWLIQSFPDSHVDSLRLNLIQFSLVLLQCLSDRQQISLLKLSEFQRINNFYSP